DDERLAVHGDERPRDHGEPDVGEKREEDPTALRVARGARRPDRRGDAGERGDEQHPLARGELQVAAPQVQEDHDPRTKWGIRPWPPRSPLPGASTRPPPFRNERGSEEPLLDQG